MAQASPVHRLPSASLSGCVSVSRRGGFVLVIRNLPPFGRIPALQHNMHAERPLLVHCKTMPILRVVARVYGIMASADCLPVL